MPLFIDHHRKVFEPTADMFTEAHQKELAVQDKYGVKFVNCWYDDKAGHMFCLSEAPNREAIADLHRDTGWDLMEIFQVTQA